MKLLLLTETLMSLVFVVNVSANLDPIVAKNLLKTFAMDLWSIISIPSSMTKGTVLFA
jgi:hypothetical protein